MGEYRPLENNFMDTKTRSFFAVTIELVLILRKNKERIRLIIAKNFLMSTEWWEQIKNNLSMTYLVTGRDQMG